MLVLLNRCTSGMFDMCLRGQRLCCRTAVAVAVVVIVRCVPLSGADYCIRVKSASLMILIES